MAKKISVKLILELRGNGMGRNAIARTRHISVNSVGDVFHKADENGISYEDVRDMDEDSVYRMFYPDKFVQESMYIRLPDLLMEYGDCAAIIGSPKKLLNRYGKIPLLILDEWLVCDISDSELYFLFELMERRSDSTSTIFCTQYRKDDWIKRLGEGVQAEAIVDRYAHTAYWIETGSMNMREYFAKPRK